MVPPKLLVELMSLQPEGGIKPETKLDTGHRM